MRRLLLALSLLASPGARADDRAAEITAAAVAELRAVDADAAAAFEQGDALRDLGKVAEAGEAYADVLRGVPDFVPALRRHCLVLQEAGMRSEALPRCRRALELAALPENHVGLAYVLLDLPSGAATTPGDRAEARQLLLTALAEDPDDAVNARLRCHLALEEEDLALLQGCVPDMERLAPDHVLTAWHVWALAVREERWEDALAALDRAETLGMPAADAASFRKLTRESMPATRRYGPALAVGGIAGGVVLVLGWGWLARRRG